MKYKKKDHLVNNIPFINREQMERVDRLMMEEYGISLVQMMENAGRNLAVLARTRFLQGDCRRKKIAVLAGSGGNGGGALVCARRLFTWGADISVILSKRVTSIKGVPYTQSQILARIGIPVLTENIPKNEFDLIIDGLIGYSLQGPPRGNVLKLIHWIHQQQTPVLSLDIPSGMDATTGDLFNPHIRADATLTLALPKKGFLNVDAGEAFGELYLGDIGVPEGLYKQLGLFGNFSGIFSKNEIIRIM